MSKSKSFHKNTASTGRNYGLLGGVAMIAFFIILLLVTAEEGFQSGTGASGEADFSATTVNGEAVSLDDYKGQVVMLNFWATWCPPCRAEMPTIQDTYMARQQDGFTVLAINNAETAAQIVPFVQAYGLEFPVLLDTDRRLQDKFGVRSFPTSIFIDGDGEIFMTHTGVVTADQLDDYIAEGLRRSNG